jgi:hypothetical protein
MKRKSHFGRSDRFKNRGKGIKKEDFNYRKRTKTISTLVTLTILFSLIVVGSYYLLSSSTGSRLTINETNQPANDNNSSDISLRAVLIDALYSSNPNVEFIESLNETLQDSGFEVDVYKGQEVTVDSLSRLASGYKLVILRMHSALSSSNELYLFTEEPFSAGKYVQEQFFRLVKEAYATESSQSVFAVNWGFVKRLMTSKFNGTTVIVMGCEGARDAWMAQEFMNQGAVGYVGWTGPVLLSHSDRATIYLIQALYEEKLSLEEAVQRTNVQIGADPSSVAVLDCYLS